MGQKTDSEIQREELAEEGRLNQPESPQNSDRPTKAAQSGNYEENLRKGPKGDGPGGKVGDNTDA